MKIPAELWYIAEQVAQELGAPPTTALRMLFVRLRYLARAGDLDMIGPEWTRHAKALRSRGTVRLEEAADDIDITKLHKSDRVRSGFVGVYSNGKGFRAVGMNPKDSRAEIGLGTFETAETAAWVRYQHYLKHGLPYGEWEDALKVLRKGNAMNSDEQLMEMHVMACDLANKPIPTGLPEETIARFRANIQRDFDESAAAAASRARSRL